MEFNPGSTYLWTKLLHTLSVIAWMAAVFYLPRILVNIAEARGEAAVVSRLVLMGQRLYRFGHILFGFVFVLGLLLWAGRLIDPALWPHVTYDSGWMHAKFLLVLLMLGHFIWAGRMLKGIASGAAPRSAGWLRIFNEVPVVLLLGILVLVFIRPI
ncbi:CopD family protein [Silanimonas sp.]|uniref:CopD family protein n=1 Tax=Silanimonas sp. TaxID=1929290 RepID=UPI001BC7B6C4|nr:CopD family protein [Silanimonas sp.]MBS3896868.1 CopD family protein [Silanimonas sp.]MBS3924801.1 CopD family protein [Xanthomonadaceae bacterium]